MGGCCQKHAQNGVESHLYTYFSPFTTSCSLSLTHSLSLSQSKFYCVTLSLSTLMASDISSHEVVQRKLNVKISGVCQTPCVIFPNYTPNLIIRTLLVSV